MQHFKRLLPSAITNACGHSVPRTLALGEPKNRLVVEPLMDRAFVRVHGKDALPFLQRVTTNDVRRLRACRKSINAGVYTLFLDRTGHVMCDGLIYTTKEPNTYLIECDRAITNDLRRHLGAHRNKRSIDLSIVDKELKPWVLFNSKLNNPVVADITRLSNELLYLNDPRIAELGMRIVTPPDVQLNDLAKMITRLGETSVHSSSNACNYRLWRYIYGVGEGVKDLPPGRCFPLEVNCDLLHGLSFDKGEFVGQESTRQAFLRNSKSKRLMPLRLSGVRSDKPKPVQSLGGIEVGNITGVCDNRALAVLRIDHVQNGQGLQVDGEPCATSAPTWWPQELRNKTMKSSS